MEYVEKNRSKSLKNKIINTMEMENIGWKLQKNRCKMGKLKKNH